MSTSWDQKDTARKIPFIWSIVAAVLCWALAIGTIFSFISLVLFLFGCGPKSTSIVTGAESSATTTTESFEFHLGGHHARRDPVDGVDPVPLVDPSRLVPAPQ